MTLVTRGEPQPMRLSELGEFRNGLNFGKGVMGSGLALVNVKDIFRANPSIDFDSLDLVDVASVRGVERYFVEKGDIFFVRSSVKRDGIGLAARADQTHDAAVHCGFVIRLRPFRQIVDPIYLTYALRTPALRSQIRGLSSGSAITNISQEALGRVVVGVPPLGEQRRIAGILSAYDDLIENNRRRIKILEEMARTLYREWFVDFRYPERKTTELSSGIGGAPNSWDAGSLGDIVHFKSGFAFKSASFTESGSHRLITIRNVQDGAFIPDTNSATNELPRNLPSHCFVSDGDILLSLTGNVGRACLVFGGTFLLNQRVAKIVPANEFDKAFAYCAVSDTEMRSKLEMLSNGVAQQNLSPVMAGKIPFALPPNCLRQKFARLVSPVLDAIVNLHSRNRGLRNTRNLLLPNLISERDTCT